LRKLPKYHIKFWRGLFEFFCDFDHRISVDRLFANDVRAGKNLLRRKIKIKNHRRLSYDAIFAPFGSPEENRARNFLLETDSLDICFPVWSGDKTFCGVLAAFGVPGAKVL
jgi:hypothetical protein